MLTRIMGPPKLRNEKEEVILEKGVPRLSNIAEKPREMKTSSSVCGIWQYGKIHKNSSSASISSLFILTHIY